MGPPCVGGPPRPATNQDEQAHVARLARAEEGGDAAQLGPVEKLHLRYTHDIHRHLARHDAHAVLLRLGDELFERGDALLAHHEPDHLGADAEHVHARGVQPKVPLGIMAQNMR